MILASDRSHNLCYFFGTASICQDGSDREVGRLDFIRGADRRNDSASESREASARDADALGEQTAHQSSCARRARPSSSSAGSLGSVGSSVSSDQRPVGGNLGSSCSGTLIDSSPAPSSWKLRLDRQSGPSQPAPAESTQPHPSSAAQPDGRTLGDAEDDAAGVDGRSDVEFGATRAETAKRCVRTVQGYLRSLPEPASSNGPLDTNAPQVRRSALRVLEVVQYLPQEEAAPSCALGSESAESDGRDHGPIDSSGRPPERNTLRDLSLEEAQLAVGEFYQAARVFVAEHTVSGRPNRHLLESLPSGKVAKDQHDSDRSLPAVSDSAASEQLLPPWARADVEPLGT